MYYPFSSIRQVETLPCVDLDTSTGKKITLAEDLVPVLEQIARRVTITKDTTTIVADGHEVQVKERCEQIRRQIDETESSYDKEELQERLAKLAGGVAVVKVGAATETEMKDKKLRLEEPELWIRGLQGRASCLG